VKAIAYERYGGPEVLQLVDLPDPAPGPGEVLVELQAASVIPADWKVRSGALTHFFDVTFPKIPGRDGAGVVAAVGDGVDYAAVGDLVCVVAQHSEAGTYAERIVRDAASVVAKPAGLTFADGAALMHAGICAWIALVETAELESGMRVLVHGGAGAIGSMAVQLAAHLGADVTATCHSSNVDYVRGLGAGQAIAYDREDFRDAAGPFDVVLDLIGGEVHARSYDVLRRGGTLVYLIAAPIEDRSADYGVRAVRAQIHDDIAALRAVVDLAERRAWRPQVSRVMPLAQAAEAHRLLERGDNTRGRLVLDIGGAAERKTLEGSD